jgi:hypothetical protein
MGRTRHFSLFEAHHAQTPPLRFFVACVSFSCNKFCVASSGKFDLVIKNGRIVNGSGNPWFYADLGIIAGKRVIDRATFEQPHQYPDGIRLV